RARRSVTGDACSQAPRRTSPIGWQAETLRRAATSMAARTQAALLATSLLRLQRLQQEETYREVARYTSQSRHSKTSRLARPMGLEQLSLLLLSRSRDRKGRTGRRSVIPRFAPRKRGAPMFLLRYNDAAGKQGGPP